VDTGDHLSSGQYPFSPTITLKPSITLQINGTVFSVNPDALGFSVFVFILTAMIATCILQVRRHTPIFGKAELGGPFTTKILTVIVFVLLWIAYVSISALEAYCMIPNLFPD
jgi:solute carrier family 8 (sodium/calcium exchanger)